MADLPLRVAVLSSFDAVPWVPIVQGFLTGLRAHGVDARGFRIAETYWHHVAELAEFAPSVILLPVHRWEAARLGPYRRWWKTADVFTMALCFDDPYDHETGLALGADVDWIGTPEPLAIPIYALHGIDAVHVPVTVSDRMHHYPRGAEDRPPSSYDVLFVGGNHWRPRNEILPRVRAACQRRGWRYGEIAGVNRWVAGEDLTAQFHRTRLTIEIPRFDLPTQTNPHQVRCTWTGPRLHIAAACGTFALVCEGRTDGAYDMYPRVSAAELLDALDYWLDREQDDSRRWVADAAWEHYQREHRPARVCAELLRHLAERGVTAESRARTASTELPAG